MCPKIESIEEEVLSLRFIYKIRQWSQYRFSIKNMIERQIDLNLFQKKIRRFLAVLTKHQWLTRMALS